MVISTILISMVCSYIEYFNQSKKPNDCKSVVFPLEFDVKCVIDRSIVSNLLKDVTELRVVASRWRLMTRLRPWELQATHSSS